jgi:hypothetical protein
MPIARRNRETALPDAWWRTRIWRTQGRTQRQLQAWPVHRQGNRLAQVGEAAHMRREGADQRDCSSHGAGTARRLSLRS